MANRALTEEQRIILASVRFVTGFLSFFASLIILYKIYLRYKQQSKNFSSRFVRNDGITTYHRMLMGVSILDVMYSFWSGLGVVATPKSSNGVFSRGTIGTCTAQGFFVELLCPIMLYMATLNVYFMLKIRYNVPDAVIVKRYEIWFHAIPITVWLILGSIGIHWELYNVIPLPELGCWIAGYPIGCIATDTCTRGRYIAQYLDWYVWSFSYMWLFLCVIVVFVNAILIYTAIWKQEQRNAKYFAARLQSGSIGASNEHVMTSPEGNVSTTKLDPFDDRNHEIAEKTEENSKYIELSLPVLNERPRSIVETEVSISRPDFESTSEDVTQDQNVNPTTRRGTTMSSNKQHPAQETAKQIKQSRVAAVQSCLYLSSAVFAAVPVFLSWLGAKLLVPARARFFIALMVSTFTPAHGMFNLFIFVRLQYLHLRKTNKASSRWSCVKKCLFTNANE